MLLAITIGMCVIGNTRQHIVEALGKEGYAAPLPQRIVTMKS
ncbi:hypothetical protein [Aquimarina addita]